MFTANELVHRCLTNHKIDNTAEDNGGDGAQSDVRQDLREEVD